MQFANGFGIDAEDTAPMLLYLFFSAVSLGLVTALYFGAWIDKGRVNESHELRQLFIWKAHCVE